MGVSKPLRIHNQVLRHQVRLQPHQLNAFKYHLRFIYTRRPYSFPSQAATVTGSNPRWGENSNGNNKYHGELAPMGHVAGAPSTHASALIGSKSANAPSVPPKPSRPRAGYVEQSHFLSQIPNYHPNAERPSPVVQTPGAGAPEHRIRRDRRRGRRRMGKQGRRRRPRGIRAGFSRYVSFYFRRIGNQLTDVVFLKRLQR